MSINNPYDKYKQNSVFTMPKEELTLMLYDGALKFCNQAISAIEGKDIPKAHELILKIQNIIREFQLTLDRTYEVSKYFDSMYEYIHRRLVEANVSKDVEALKEMRELIREFRDTWKEAIVLSRK